MKLRFEKGDDYIEIKTKSEAPDIVLDHLKLMLQWMGMSRADVDESVFSWDELEALVKKEIDECSHLDSVHKK